jgi:phage head maturation protease
MMHDHDHYEMMSARRDFEDARRGYSIGDFGGSISVGVSLGQQRTTIIKRSGTPQVLQGAACNYDVIHFHKGRKEMFAPGCFDGSLFGVFLLIDHDLRSKKLGDQDDGSLELIDTPTALNFRLKLMPGHLDRIGSRDSMSVSYREESVETRQIARETVRVIKKASLFEISVCHGGAVPRTFAIVADAANVGLLRDDATRSFPRDGAFAVMQRAMRKLVDAL